ncbi:DUF3618 domain-containing protein [Amycolatopsis magusensis]|uniref:Cell division protein FtsB n=1 Tax=Amycolatopsis magusensis TaxID=882444 RepID=A0ABS4Q5J6_9PSEU|nr:DUF3618 domain-containing protein [Amycolatopsis magusensis]MBP2186964.1 hypothetical protein [Amycolatopsis magusensis]MDI5975098.1 DUF3618 domain-containing protein [Amycolatopsis magusensis]
MARDPDTIEREIEKAREALASTLDELSVKANPKRLADSAKTSVLAKLSEPKVKYALIGAGALVGVLLLRKLFR